MMNQRGLFSAFFVLIFVLYGNSDVFASDANGHQGVIQWPENVYGSVSPINFTVGYTTFSQGWDVPEYYLNEDQIKRVVNHWAVGVYEMTNGVHHLGRIKVIKNNEKDFAEFFHVKWLTLPQRIDTDTGTYIPYAQHGNKGGQLRISTPQFKKRPFAEYTGADNNHLRFAGYSLAHETAHYLYGIRDEYAGLEQNNPQVNGPRPTDNLRAGAEMFIMNQQEFALLPRNQTEVSLGDSEINVTSPGSAKWLNFSTPYNYDENDEEVQTVQSRSFGMSVWDAIASKTAFPAELPDPRYRKYWYQDLSEAKPSESDGWYKLQYPEYGLPEQDATNFAPPGDTKFELPTVEFGRPARVRLISRP